MNPVENGWPRQNADNQLSQDRWDTDTLAYPPSTLSRNEKPCKQDEQCSDRHGKYLQTFPVRRPSLLRERSKAKILAIERIMSVHQAIWCALLMIRDLRNPHRNSPTHLFKHSIE